MGINRLRNRVGLYALTYTSDGMGGSTKTATLVATLWARIEREDGSRIQEGDMLNTTKPVIITLRAGTYQVTTDNIIRFNDKDFTIHSVAYDERNRFTSIIAYEGNTIT